MRLLRSWFVSLSEAKDLVFEIICFIQDGGK